MRQEVVRLFYALGHLNRALHEGERLIVSNVSQHPIGAVSFGAYRGYAFGFGGALIVNL